VRLARISRLRNNDRRTYGEVTGVIWLQTSCQPVGIFYEDDAALELATRGFPAVLAFQRCQGGRR
jgi:hypothetical protein